MAERFPSLGRALSADFESLLTRDWTALAESDAVSSGVRVRGVFFLLEPDTATLFGTRCGRGTTFLFVTRGPLFFVE